MGTVLVLAFVFVFGLAIGQALLRRRLNPFAEVEYAGLPAELRTEIERVLPGFASRTARLTKRGDEARLEGEYRGEPLRIEADFDARGRLVDFEADGPRSSRTRDLASPADLPPPAAREIERVLGDARRGFQPSLVTRGSRDGVDHFEVKGHAAGWKWEIAVDAEGRLLEVERERRRGR